MNQRNAWLMLGLLTATLLVTVMLLLPATGSASSSQGACSATHVVRKGDTLARIAVHYGVSVSAIIRANPRITNPDLIYVSQKLCIPGGMSSPDPKPGNIPPKGNTSICVTGQVIDTNHKGIGGITVVADLAGQLGGHTGTDENGHFQFDDLYPETWFFSVLLPDLWKAATPAELMMDLSYDKVGCYHVQFKLEPRGCAIVYKKDAEGNPISECSVRISGPMDTGATTDKDGIARCNDLVPGSYTIEDDAPYPWKPLTPSRVSFEVKPAMSADDCAVVEFINEKQPTSCVTGQKVDDLHNGIAGWTIRAKSAEGYEVEPQVTDAGGYFTFENLTLGQWTLWEEMQDGWTPITPAMFSVTLVDEGQPPECVSVRFKNQPPDLCAEGLKVDENGKGLAGWKVFAYPSSNPDLRIETLTDEGGRFRVNGLTSEGWVFEVEGRTGWKPIGKDSVEVVIAPSKGCTQVPIFYSRSPRGCIEGFKRDDLEVGLPGWNISLQPIGGGKYMHAETDGAGHFRFDNLPAGEYEVWEEAQAGWSALTPMRQIVEVTPSDEPLCERIEFINQQARRDICIDGYKVDQYGGVGLPGVAITASNPATGEEIEVKTDGLGYFRFSDLEPGTYEVTAAEPEGWVAVGPSQQTVKVDWPPKIQCAAIKFYDRQANSKPPHLPVGCVVWHTVKAGDTLAKIAAHYHVPLRTMIYANHIQNPDLIYKGQKLCIPDP